MSDAVLARRDDFVGRNRNLSKAFYRYRLEYIIIIIIIIISPFSAALAAAEASPVRPA